MASKAFVFAGQGAQVVGMGEAYPACRALYAKADEVLGFSLSKICFEGPETELTKSNRCQPAIFVTSMACYTALGLEAGRIDTAGVAGLSLGEWSALNMAGALTFEDTLAVLEARGRFMQEACEEREGGMVSVIGLSLDQIKTIAQATGVEIANLNSPDQTVLSGPRAGIAEAAKAAEAAGAKRAIVLNVAGAFHSSLMASAADKLAPVLARTEIRTPAVPVIANVTGQPHGTPDEIRSTMLRQVTSSVRWQSCVEWLAGAGAQAFIECGPGKILSGLIRRIVRDVGTFNVQDIATLKQTTTSLRS